MSTTKQLAWGILGTGNIARQFATGLQDSQRGTLAAVGSRHAETARTFAGAHGGERAYGSYQELLDDPKVQAVYVSLPNSMHHEWTIKALRAGKHVLCEKPMATNLAQAQEMFDVAKREGKVLVEAFMYRSHPMTLALEKVVREGRIGKVKMIRSSFVYATGNVAGNVRFDAGLAGGALMDIGCYCTSYARLFAGAEPTAMTVHGHLHASKVDDYAAGVMAFPEGVLSTFMCGMTVHAENTAHLLGTGGYIEIPVPWKPPVMDAEFTVVEGGGKRETVKVSAGKHLYALEADDFAASVLEGMPARVSVQDSLGNQAVLDEMRRQVGVKY